MSDEQAARRQRARERAERLHRHNKRAQTVTILVMVLGIGLLVALVSAMSFTLGLSPEREVLRRGEVEIIACSPTPTSLGTTQRCRAKVLDWEPEDQWVKGRLAFSEADEVVVTSRSRLQGRVEVESHRQRWRVTTGGPTSANSSRSSEVLVPAGWTPAPAAVGVLVIIGCLVIPIGAGLGVSWLMHRTRRQP